MRIFLTGFMGAGKTTIGRYLAETLELPFVDLDSEIERQAGLTVREIFARYGEPEFRRLEHESLKMLCEKDHLVAATGGGTVTIDLNRKLIAGAGISVWLHPPFSTIIERIREVGKEDRPLFQNEMQAWELYRQRLVAYRRCDLRVDVEPHETAEEVATRIALMVRSRPTCAI